jgi:hypothetical protein
MLERSPLHAAAFERFTRAFGPPDRTEDKDIYWSLRPFSYVAAINVLVNGSGDTPLVWVFDPHDPSDGVSSTRIHNESELEELVRKIEHRVKTAGRPLREH